MAISKLLKNVRKNTGSMSFKDSKLTEIDHWVDTGSYALNRIMSGNIHYGMPSGRVLLLGGENSVGKTYFVANMVKNAIEKNNYTHIFYFDSEGGGLKTMFEDIGIDLEKIEHIPVKTLEDARIKIGQTYMDIEEYKEEGNTYMCILDSLGMLVPQKTYDDTKKKKAVSEMGLSAKQANMLIKSIVMPSLITNTMFIVTNHVYDNPAEMYTSKIKQQSGGKRLHYASTISLQLTKKYEKGGESEETKYSGNTIHAFTIKNRIVKPLYETEIFIDFDKGIKKYSGLVEAAKSYGLVQQAGAWYKSTVNDVKVCGEDALLSADEFWEAGILDIINEKSKEEMSYSRNEKIKLEKEVEDENV